MVRLITFLLIVIPSILYAAVYEIVEPDFVETAKAFAQTEEFKELAIKEQNRQIDMIKASKGELLLQALNDSEYDVEYYYTLPQDMPKVDRNGNIVGILYPKGYTFAPLKFMKMAPPPLIIYNPCDKEELELVNDICKIYDKNYQRYILLTSGCSLEEMSKLELGTNNRFLLDKDSVKKFNLRYTVSVKADTFINIQTAAFETIDNMLPIKIGAIEIDNIDNTQGGLADMGGLGGGGGSDTDGTFLCMCQVPPPVFERLGVTMSFWNNVGMIDTSSIPYCFPQLGQYLDLGGTVGGSLEALTGKAGIGGANQFGKRSSGGKQKGDQFISAHTHFASFTNLMKIVSDAIFSMCFSADMATNISPQMSEVFFWWQNDEWGVLKNPEALLVANPIATAACMAESLSVSILGTSLDPLFWCMGSWGSLYPITMNVGSGTPLTSYAMLAARNLSERFQLAMLMDTTGYQMLNGYCQPYPTYFIPKILV